MKSPRRSRAAGPFPVTINPGNYNGFYVIDPPGWANPIEWQSGINTVLLYEGTHFFDIGQSSFTFDVDSTGRVVRVSDKDAAQPSKDGFSLDVHTARVNFDPGAYGEPGNPGYYFLKTCARHNSSGYPGTGVRGKQTVALIPSLEYYVDDGSYIGDSIFAFTLTRKGGGFVISNIRPAGVATGAHTKTLRFATAPMRIAMGGYRLDYMLSTYRYVQLRRDRTVNLIRGLTLGFFNGAASVLGNSSSYFYATVGLDGNWSGLRSASGGPCDSANINGDLLTFNVVNVTITPDNAYGGKWRLSSDAGNWTTGSRTVGLIPGLLYWVQPEGLPEKYFTLRVANADPTSLTWNTLNFTIAVGP